MSPYAIDGSIQGTDIKANEFMRIAIVGAPKVGKSWFAATIGDTPWFNDFDGRINSLHGKDITGKTYYDADPMNAKAWTTFENDLVKFEQMKVAKQDIPKTFINDSMQQMCKAAMDLTLMMGASNKNICRKVSVGAKTIYAPGGYDAWDAEYKAVHNAISRQFALGNVICNFHEHPEEALGSTQENPIYTGKLTVFPVRMNKLLILFNEVWRLEVQNGQRQVYTDLKDYKFNSASSLLVDSIEQPDIQQMFKKHLSRVGK